MSGFRFTGSLFLILACALATSAATADTLELKDGSLLEGSFKGGSQTSVRFETAGEIKVIAVTDILSLTFTGPAPGAPAAAKAPAPSKPLTVPAGTGIHFKFTQGINSKGYAGLEFKGELETALFVDGVEVAPKGAPIYGKLIESKKAGRLVGQAELEFTLTHIVIKKQRIPISTEIFKATGERQRSGRKVAGGAAIGAMFGGKKGAKYGAAGGATLAALTPGKQVQIPAGHLMEFKLTKAITLK